MSTCFPTHKEDIYARPLINRGGTHSHKTWQQRFSSMKLRYFSSDIGLVYVSDHSYQDRYISVRDQNLCKPF